ncbi:LOW QUALITY PROTEIN: apolipophorins-like [Diaphorina citri]|uniref:LOW QUALITY PROTEIN: apolipophorins-like n=1 Tax=Diaphorina citri TaxID=121845 RepID=A0A3Q0IJI9_DIACI|nr:LOW QUALITY PROTEIN: apolipophorins-like [Diaphorina citri]
MGYSIRNIRSVLIKITDTRNGCTSAAVELVGVLSVDGYVAESGLKLTSTLHSSTGTEIFLKNLPTYGVELKVGVPLKKQDIINFKTEITSVVKEPGLAYVETPIKFNSLLDDSASWQVYFGAGSLANRYFREHSVQNVPEFSNLLQKLAEPLKGGCIANKEGEEYKDLQSSPLLYPTYDSEQKFENGVLKESDVSETYIYRPLASPESGAKVKVHSKLSLVSHAKGSVSDVIPITYSHCSYHPSHLHNYILLLPVRYFILSHLRNLKSTVNPSKEAAKFLYGAIPVPPKYLKVQDLRKYSSNHEFSYLFDSLNVGASGEGNIIFSPKSFVPRVLSLNLTTQVFGQAFNVFEVDIRAENLEYLLEREFGPRGRFNSKENLNNVTKTAKYFYDELKDKYKRLVQPRKARSAEALFDEETFDSKYRNVRPDSAEELMREDDDDSLERTKRSADSDAFYKKIIASLRGLGNVKYLTPEVAALVGNCFSNPKVSTKIRAIALDTFQTDAGKPELAQLTEELNPYRGTVESLWAEYGGCFDQLLPLIGLTPCAVVSFPFDGQKFLNPIYGPSKVSLKVDKEDDSLKSFLFKGVFVLKPPRCSHNFDLISVQDLRTFEFLLDTPNSKTERKVQVLGEYKTSPEKKEVKASFVSPIKTAELEGSIIKSNTQSAISGKVLSDGVEYSFKLGAETTGSGSHRTYKPFLEYKIPELSSNSKLITKKGGKKQGLQAVTVEGNYFSVALSGDIDYDLDVYVKILGSGVGWGHINGEKLEDSVDLDDTIAKAVQDTEDAVKRESTKKFDFKKHMTFLDAELLYPTSLGLTLNCLSPLSQNDQEQKLDIYFEVRPSQYPDFGIAYDYSTIQSKIEQGKVIQAKTISRTKFTHGNNPQSETSRLSYDVKSHAIYSRETHDFEFSEDDDFSYPLFNVNAKASTKINFKKDAGTSINIDITGKYEKAAFLSQLDAKIGQKKSGEYDISFKNKFLTNSLEAELKRVIVSDEKEKFTNSLTFASDTSKAGNAKYSLNADVTSSKKPDTINRRIQASLFLPQEEKPLKIDTGYKWASSEVKTHIDVTLGDDPYLSTSSQVLLSKTSPSGNFKLDLSDLLKSKAAFKFVAGKEYSNDFTIQLLAPKLQRTVQSKTSLTIDGEKYKGFFEILLDAEKDPSKKVRLDTETSLKWTDDKKRFATDNQFTLLNYITKFKADAKVDNLVQNGKHSWSFDLTFPNEAILKGNYNGESNIKDPESDYKFDLELARDGKTTEALAKLPKKLNLNVKVDKIDPAKETFNSDVKFKLLGESESLVDVDANVYSLVNGDKWVYGYEHKAKGSVVPENRAKFSTEQSTEYLSEDLDLFEKKSFPPLVTKLEFGLTSIGEGQFELALKGKKLSYNVAGKIDEKYSSPNSIQEFRLNSDNTFDIDTSKSVLESDNSFKWNKDKFIRVNFGLHGKEKGISVNGEVETHSVPKRTFSGSLTGEVPAQNVPGKIDGSLSVKWENQEAGLSIKGETFQDKTGGKLSVTANHPKTGKVEIFGSNKILKDNKGVNAELSFIRNDKKVKLGLKTDLTKNKPEFDFTVEQNPTGKVEIFGSNKILKDNKGVNAELSFIRNDKKVKLGLKTDLTKNKPEFDFTVEQNAGKSRVYVKYDKKDKNHIAAAVKLQWIANGGGFIDADVDGDLRSVDDFTYKLNFDSPVLNLNKIRFEVENKPSKGETQKIQYSVKSGGKVLVTGSSNYVYKDEGDRKVVEGAGSFKYEDKTYPVTFKYIMKTLHKSTDGETGELHKVSVVCEGMKIKYEGENKFTDEVFRVYRNYCNDDKCYVNELSYKYKGSDVLDYEQELIVQLDFRPLLKYSKLPESHPFSLKASTKRYGFSLNQQLEIKWSPTDKIEYNVYFESTKAGVIVALPKRTLALESTYDLKKEKGLLYEANLWLDKTRAPEQKTGLLVKYDNSFDKDQRTMAASGEVKFSHPALSKDLSLSGRGEFLKDWANVIDANVDIDVFQKKGQNIVIDLQVNREKRENGEKVNTKFSIVSKEQNLHFVLGGYTLIDADKVEDHTTLSYTDKNNKKREGLIHFEYSKQKFSGKVLLFDLIQWKGIEELKINQKDNYLEYTSKHEINGNKFGERLTINKKAILDYVLKWKCHDKPERELGFKGEFNYNTKAEVQVTALKDGKKVEVAVATLKFDQENFLKPSEAVSLDDIKDLVVTSKDDFKGILKDHTDVVTKIGKEFREESAYRSAELTKAKPNLKPVLTAINNQLKELKEEIANDKALKDTAEHVKNTFNDFLESFVTLFEAFTHVLETVTTVSFDLANKISEAFINLAPAISDAYAKISKYAIEAIDSVLKTGVTLVNTFIDELKKHEADFKGITAFGNDLFLGVGKVVAKWYAQVQVETAEVYRRLAEQVKSLPVYPLIQEKIEEFKNLQVPENVLSVILEVLESLKDSLPTPELQNFADALIDYLKKITDSDKKINLDSEELKKLLDKFLEAFKSLFAFIPAFKPTGTNEELLKPSSVLLPIPTLGLFKYPLKFGSIHVSTFNTYLNGELPFKISQGIYTAFRGLLKPEELLPPYKAIGLIVDKGYVFTYNGKWLPLAGSCSYVLAQDLKNNNFSVSIKVQNGKLSSVVVTDKEDEVEVFVDKKIKLNGAATEYPVRSKNLHSWRQYGKVVVLGLSGIHVSCSDTFDLCSVIVNGYYQNKVHGLLGAHNLEPYLDFTLPNGKHTDDKSEFYNSYAVGGCASPAKITEVSEKSSECKDLFHGNSTLSSGHVFINIKPYLEACSNEINKLSTHEQKEEKACQFAAAYSTAVNLAGGFWLTIPFSCQEYVTCPDQGSERIKGFEPPYSRADIVLVVEEDVKNEEVYKNLVLPLIPALTEDLKKVGLTDPHFSLIGYGSTAWPQLFTKDGEFEFDANSAKISFVDTSDKDITSEFSQAKTPEARVKWFLKSLNLLGDQSLTSALHQAAIYPFRPGSARAIILVGSTLPKRRPVDSLTTAYPLIIAEGIGARVIYVGPIKASVKDKQDEDIAGFDEDQVFLLSESKPRNVRGNEELSDTLDIDHDYNAFADIFNSDGAFNSEVFLKANPEQKKVFTGIVSDTIAKKLSKQAIQVCTCWKPNDRPAISICANDILDDLDDL